MNDPRGSLWRKWDLHVHTPESLVQGYGANNDETWERFLTELESLPPEYKVIGINDYIFIDGYKRVIKAKSDGRLKNIDLILPVIELRLDKFGGTDSNLSKINFHIIFSNEVNPDIIHEQFLNAIKPGYRLSPQYEDIQQEWSGLVTKNSLEDLGRLIIESVPHEKRSQYSPPLTEGFNNLNFSYDKILDALKSPYFKDRYLTAVGKTEWADIKWNDHSIAEKKTIINDSNLVFISSETIEAFDKAKRNLTTSKVNDRLLDCSDAHYFNDALSKDRIGKCFTWIKADTTFEGLMHVLSEWERRVYIGDIPNKLNLVKNHRTKYIKGIKINKKANSRLDEIWFENCQLSFNFELVAIIGNKGMGKSALTDMLALLGNTSSKDFSFLNKQKFRDPKNNKSLDFEAQIIWESGEESLARCLAEDVPEHEVELVKYIPQKFFEMITNENAIEEGSKFDKELKKVIFSHVDEPNKLGCASLDELIEYRTEEIKDVINSMRSELKDINEKIIKLEYLTSEDHKQDLGKQLETKKQELSVHDSSRPTEIDKPIVSPSIEEAFKDLRSEIETLTSNITEAKSQLNRSVKILASISKIKGKIENLRRMYDNFVIESSEEFDKIGVKMESIARLDINESLIQQYEREYSNKQSQSEELIDRLENNKKVSEEKLYSLQSTLDEANRSYQHYLDEITNWDQLREVIIGSPDQHESIEYYKNALNESSTTLVDDLSKAKLERNSKVEAIFLEIKKLVNIYIDLYKPVQDFIDNHELIDRYQLNFNVSIIQQGFIDAFLSHINQSAKGTFHGTQDGRDKLKEIIDKYDFNSISNVMQFIAEIQESIEIDKRDSINRVKIESQLRKSFKKQDLYEFLYSLKYLEPRYILQLGGKELLQLSPGERGVLLLIFYLLVDKDDCPLIIDQPEDNLDNQSVYELIAPCISEARLRRQVFIITHNPNLAVVCDAEQVIAASINKLDKERVEYVSGAIENPSINKKIIDILEGTKPAFKKRESKYF
ncbi:hypothetical protein Mhar_1209 [Methanothrix harundinacea 6Ac]|uniref:ATPase AAA-type core domain-containing protein n=2 Tax=Methanothrix harundinacea TaxID=301375 RepID=G7WN10_METH6|nr:hypothetical protein Mhar_1209 [Methanothrix harundinacea 6Ac]